MKTQTKTRKLSYRKDDLAMRPIYGCPDNFREFLSTPTATFARSILWMCVQKFEVRSFTHSWDNREY